MSNENCVAILLTQDELERLISALQTKHGEPPSQRDWSLQFADRLKRLRGAGDTPETEFFVIRLKDKYAAAALYAYGNQARHDDPEWAEEIFALADKAKALHETGQSKMPD